MCFDLPPCQCSPHFPLAASCQCLTLGRSDWNGLPCLLKLMCRADVCPPWGATVVLRSPLGEAQQGLFGEAKTSCLVGLLYFH